MPLARYLGIGKESSWGTGVAPDDFFEILSESLQLETETIRIKTIRTAAVRQVERAFVLVRGTIEVVCSFEELPILFGYLLGDADTSGAGPTYTHTIPGTGGQVDRPSLSVEINRDGFVTRYTGCKITTIGLAVTLNQEARCTVGFIGKVDDVQGSAASDSYKTFAPMVPRMVNVSLDGGSTQRAAQSFNLNVNYPVDEPAKLGSINLATEPLDSDSMEVVGDSQILFLDPDDDAYTEYAAGTKVDVQLSAAGDDSESFTVNLNSCLLTSNTPHVAGRERNTTTANFESEFDTDDTGNLQVVAVNHQTSLPVTA